MPPRPTNDAMAAQTLAQQAITEVRNVMTKLEGHERLDESRHEATQKEIGGVHKLLEDQKKTTETFRAALSTDIVTVHNRVSEVKRGLDKILKAVLGAALIILLGIVLTRIGLKP